MNRTTTSIILVVWVVLMTFIHGININTLVAFMFALPVIGFVFYLIWFDSKKPKDQQFRHYNSARYKKRNQL